MIFTGFMAQHEAKIGTNDVFFSLRNKMVVESKKMGVVNVVPNLTGLVVDTHWP